MTTTIALTQMKAKSLGKGKYADGQGLWLVKSRRQTGKWILRIVVDGNRREMGLGRWPDVSIAEARQSASEARRKLRGGIDPIQERRQRRRRVNRLTVAEAVKSCFEAKQAELKNDGHAGRWMSPLNTHVLPKIGKKAIEDIDQHELKRVLEPIWHEKPDTARKAMNRMNLTLKHGAALGLDVDLQAVMKVRALLGKQRHEVKHIPSLTYKEAPAFYQWLCTKSLVSALALRFLIVTAARTSEIRFATFDEIEDEVWTLGPDRTKTGREHRIPLSNEATAIVQKARKSDEQKILFPAGRGKPMSDAAMSSFMEREGYKARPHGFRATFRTWVEETTDTPYEVKESALGHQVDGEVVRAYQRSDRLEKRAELMACWADYLLSN
ncbi:tyrosine-type recombinase/integrase [bacterium AH-315-P15]|nr:tyrosine-type recombinase/integrase [bacterium AH-315-P15]